MILFFLLLIVARRVFSMLEDDMDINSIVMENIGAYIDFRHFGLYYDESFIIKYRHTIVLDSVPRDKVCSIGVYLDEYLNKTFIDDQLSYLQNPEEIKKLWCNYKQMNCSTRSKRFLGVALLGAGIFVEGVLSSYNLIQNNDLKHDFNDYRKVSSEAIVHLDQENKILLREAQNMTNYVESLFHQITTNDCKLYQTLFQEKVNKKIDSIIKAGNGKVTPTFLPIKTLRLIISNNYLFHNSIYKTNPSLFYETVRSVLIQRDDKGYNYDYILMVPLISTNKIAKIYDVVNVGWGDLNNNYYYGLPRRFVAIKSEGTYYPFLYDDTNCKLVENIMVCNTRNIQFDQKSQCLSDILLSNKTELCSKYVISGKMKQSNYYMNHGILLTGYGKIEYVRSLDDKRFIFHKAEEVNHHKFIKYDTYKMLRYHNQLYHTRQIVGNYTYVDIMKFDTSFIPKETHFYFHTDLDDINDILRKNHPLSNDFNLTHFILSIVFIIILLFLIIVIIVLALRLKASKNNVRSIILGLRDAHLID